MLAVVSPHCDDGVFGCGDLLATRPGAVVITVFAGGPPAYGTITPWDAASGFGEGDDVMAIRREEDRAALERLRATPVWLDFCDSQYGRPVSVEAIAAAVGETLDRTQPSAVLAPLGLFHSDHRLASDACLAVRRPAITWLLYEDAIYRRIPGLVDERVDQLAHAGVMAVPVERTHAPSRDKRAALTCYVSQLRALSRPGYPGWDDALAPERYWEIGA